MSQSANDILSRLHPAVALGYFLCAIGSAVLIANPLFAVAGIEGAALYWLVLRGRAGVRLILGMVPLFLVLTLINPLFNTEGDTVLLTYGPDRPYTLEALVLGATMAGMLVAALLWFASFNRVMTADKLLYLLGGHAPALATALTLVLRLVPSFGRRARATAAARAGVGLSAGEGRGAGEKARQGAAVVTSLTGWALEQGVVTADSLRSRGFGTARRTSWRRFRFGRIDGAFAVALVALAALVVGGVVAGATAMEATAHLRLLPPGVFPLVVLAAYHGMAVLPTVIEGGARLRWRCLRSKM